MWLCVVVASRECVPTSSGAAKLVVDGVARGAPGERLGLRVALSWGCGTFLEVFDVRQRVLSFQSGLTLWQREYNTCMRTWVT